MRILLAVCRSTATRPTSHDFPFLGGFVFGLGNWLLARIRVSFHVHGNGPDEAQQFSSDGGYDFGFVLASAQEVTIALVQPVLGLPGDFFDLFTESLLALAQSPTATGTMAIRPGGLDYDAAKVSVPRLGDGSPLNVFSAGVFTRRPRHYRP